MQATETLIVDYSPKALAVVADKDSGLSIDFEAIGGRYNPRLKFGEGWIFSKAKHETQLREIYADYEIEWVVVALSELDCPTKGASDKEGGKGSTKGSGDKEAVPEYILTDKERRAWATDKMNDNGYYYEHCNIVVQMPNGVYVPIEKPRIKTDFWFGESDCGQGPSFNEANESAAAATESTEYFLAENREDLLTMLTILEHPGTPQSRNRYAWLRYYGSGTLSFKVTWERHDRPELLDSRDKEDWNLGNYYPVNEQERQRLIVGYKLALKQFDKRLQAYLKRYGLSKVSARTYWMDR